MKRARLEFSPNFSKYQTNLIFLKNSGENTILFHVAPPTHHIFIALIAGAQAASYEASALRIFMKFSTISNEFDFSRKLRESNKPQLPNRQGSQLSNLNLPATKLFSTEIDKIHYSDHFFRVWHFSTFQVWHLSCNLTSWWRHMKVKNQCFQT